MTTWKGTRLTWSRLGIGISIGLVLFGAIDAALPHSARPSAGLRGGVARDPRFRGHNGLRTRGVGAGQRSPTCGRGVRLRPPTPPIRHTPRATQPSEPHWPQPSPCHDEWRGRRPGWQRIAGRRWCSTLPVLWLRSGLARLPWSSLVGRW